MRTVGIYFLSSSERHSCVESGACGLPRVLSSSVPHHSCQVDVISEPSLSLFELILSCFDHVCTQFLRFTDKDGSKIIWSLFPVGYAALNGNRPNVCCDWRATRPAATSLLLAWCIGMHGLGSGQSSLRLLTCFDCYLCFCYHISFCFDASQQFKNQFGWSDPSP